MGPIVSLLRQVGPDWRLDVLMAEGGDGLPVAIFLGDRASCVRASELCCSLRSSCSDGVSLTRRVVECFASNAAEIDDRDDLPPTSQQRPIGSIQQTR